MDNKETLKTMLQDIINGKEEQAAMSMHDYFVAKTREVAGFSNSSQQDELGDLDLSADDADDLSEE